MDSLHRADVAPEVPTGVTDLVVLYEYGGPARELILGLKHNRSVDALPLLADRLAEAVSSRDWADAPTAVTWVPTTPERRRDRGYDQSYLLARATARRLGVPCRRLLRRTGHAQEGLDATARRVGPELSALRSTSSPVLLVDDVVTTGSTLAAAAAVLRAAGVPEVYAAALAFSPAPTAS